MRFYGKRFLNQSIQKQMEGKIETRDAILWDVLPDQRLCRVKIQGSNQLIVAHYPENWEKTPVYLKPGNAVRITHRMGVRGKIEIVGHGQVVPTPVFGDSSPALGTPEDGVLTGCVVTASIPPAMTVAVGTGTYRIDEVEYTISSEQEVAVSAAPSYGYYRMDLIQIAADGVVDCKPGTPATSDPVAPDPDSGHIALGTVLVPWGNTTIPSQYINVEWSAPAAKGITIIPDDNDLAWAETQTDVVVKVIDQYGNGIATDSPGWHLTLEIVAGNGEVWSADDGWQTDSVSADTGANSYYTFKYKRDQLATDESPTLKASVDGDFAAQIAYCFITVRDEDGNAMGAGYTDPGALQVYQTIQDEGTPITQRKIINFIGDGVTVEDDAVNGVTKVTILKDVVQSLTPDDNVTIDWSLGNVATILLNRPTTTFAFTGANNGQKMVLICKQDGTGGRAIAFGAEVRGGTDLTIPPTLTATINKADYLGFIYTAFTAKYDFVAFSKGY